MDGGIDFEVGVPIVICIFLGTILFLAILRNFQIDKKLDKIVKLLEEIKVSLKTKSEGGI